MTQQRCRSKESKQTEKLVLFANQVGGHEGMLSFGPAHVMKPIAQFSKSGDHAKGWREVDFYHTKLCKLSAAAQRHIPAYYGVYCEVCGVRLEVVNPKDAVRDNGVELRPSKPRKYLRSVLCEDELSKHPRKRIQSVEVKCLGGKNHRPSLCLENLLHSIACSVLCEKLHFTSSGNCWDNHNNCLVIDIKCGRYLYSPQAKKGRKERALRKKYDSWQEEKSLSQPPTLKFPLQFDVGYRVTGYQAPRAGLSADVVDCIENSLCKESLEEENIQRLASSILRAFMDPSRSANDPVNDSHDKTSITIERKVYNKHSNEMRVLSSWIQLVMQYAARMYNSTSMAPESDSLNLCTIALQVVQSMRASMEELRKNLILAVPSASDKNAFSIQWYSCSLLLVVPPMSFPNARRSSKSLKPKCGAYLIDFCHVVTNQNSERSTYESDKNFDYGMLNVIKHLSIIEKSLTQL